MSPSRPTRSSAEFASDLPVPEVPFASELLRLVSDELEAARQLVQRLITIDDALFAAATTGAGLFIGLALSNNAPELAFIAIPIVLAIGIVGGETWTHFRRATSRVRRLETILRSYAGALRESGPARPRAVEKLRSALDGYTYGLERSTFNKVTPTDIWRTNRTRLRWWLYALLAVALLIAGAASRAPSEPKCFVVRDSRPRLNHSPIAGVRVCEAVVKHVGHATMTS